MAFDLVEFLPDFLRGHEGVVEVALFELVVFGDEGLVVGEGFYCWGLDELLFLTVCERGVGKRGMGEGAACLLLSSGSARKRWRNNSVFRVALPVHMSQTWSLKGSATNSYSGPSMMSFGHTSGGWALGSSDASSFWAGRRPRCSRQRRRRSVAAWWPAR